MQKRIFAAAIILMVFVLVAVACGKKGDSDDPTNTEPFSYTTDADGTVYVTNIYGDLIPVTTGADGSVEMLEDLYTKTVAQVEEEKKNLETANQNEGGNQSGDQSGNEGGSQGGNEGSSQGGSQSGNQGGSQSGNSGIQVGSEEAVGDEKEAIINW